MDWQFVKFFKNATASLPDVTVLFDTCQSRSIRVLPIDNYEKPSAAVAHHDSNGSSSAHDDASTISEALANVKPPAKLSYIFMVKFTSCVKYRQLNGTKTVKETVVEKEAAGAGK